MSSFDILVLFTGFSFIFFGINCFVNRRYKSEFLRYGLRNYRNLIGILQLMGGLGLLIGFYFYLPLSVFAAVGLTLLMLAGFGVRIKLGDRFVASAPSLLYAGLSCFLAYRLYAMIEF
ncbi:MAG: hypothetical protein HKN48_04050 [Flavobacteriaceae bacterium]|nr:hypothetical protein [Flavobacteriaceae bacterium]